MTTTVTPKQLITGGNPEARFPIPETEQFDERGDDFIEAPEIARVGHALIAERPEFAFLQNATIEFVWRRKGGTSNGNIVLGKAVKPSGLVKHYSGADFVFWFAADHLRDSHPTAWQMEALIDHELRHAHEEDGKFSLGGHDFEGFAAELHHYGFYQESLRLIKRATRQMPLFEDED